MLMLRHLHLAGQKHPCKTFLAAPCTLLQVFLQPIMSTTKTAVVEVLTAEVRVLMVGSRQVTLSVARQLDEVPWEECKPFGRIRYTRDDEPGLAIIGQDPEGNLCRSRIDYDDLKAMNHLLKNHKAGSYFSGGYVTKNGEMTWESAHHVTAEEYQGWVEKQRPLLEAYRKQRNEFDSLPLIVLAGLK